MPVSRDAALGRIRLRHLQCFLAVVRGGNLRSGADALAITQPAVTKTLNELEEILGVRLFERGRRGALPTPEAEVLRATRRRAPMRSARRSTACCAARTKRRCAWACCRRWRRRSCRMRCSRCAPSGRTVCAGGDGRNRELLALLRQHELDLGVGRMAEPDEMVGLTFELLYAEPLVIAARAGHPLLGARKPAPAAIGERPIVLPPVGTIIRHAVDSWFAHNGTVPRGGLTETLSISLARALALGSDALWFTPRSAAEPDLDSGALVALPLSTAGTEEPVGLLLRTDNLPSAALRSLLAALRAQAVARRGGDTPGRAGAAPSWANPR